MQPDKIELGLERIKQVAVSAGLDHPDFKIITVAGTNGKGSTVAYCDAMLRHMGYHTGVYTSPHFIEFNERIVVGNKRVDDQLLCDAFDAIDKVRADVPLTYFEFTTLAAMHCFMAAKIDVAVLEVGLGGRLDAVNAWDSEVACITSIGIDHTDWLGDDRESIGREKAGVARQGKVLVCGDTDPPVSIAETLKAIGANLQQRGRDFDIELVGVKSSDQVSNQISNNNKWRYRDQSQNLLLPCPAIDAGWAFDNAAVAICAVSHFVGSSPAPDSPNLASPKLASIEYALEQVTMTGRMQMLNVDDVPVILDVAHNKAAAEKLADYLGAHAVDGVTRAVFACMNDKDLTAIVAALASSIDQWLIAELDYPRAMSPAEIQKTIQQAPVPRSEPVNTGVYASVIQATRAAVAQSESDDRVVVFGSFHVVGPALEVLT